MTKMKSKKMTKSTFAIIIMAIVMVAMLAFGGTYAYFTATADKTTTTAVKTAKIAIKEATASLTLAQNMENVLPGDTVTLSASVTNESNRAIYVFINVQVDLPKSDTASNVGLDLISALEDGGVWTAYEDSDETTNYFYAPIASGADIELTAAAKFTADENSDEGVVDGTIMDQDLTVTVRFAAIQSENLEGADETAKLATAFGLVKSNLSLA